MSDLSFRPGGALKLKGDGGEKKKKKKSKAKEALVGREVIKSKAMVDALVGEDKASKATRTQNEEDPQDSPAPGSSTPIAGTSSSSGKEKTDAERRFEEIQRRRLADKVAKLAKKTHKDRVHEFNSKLESLSEHHDIPKVGPG